ncbi:hypothetical protein IFM89_039483 [Coptis chinensis]|uniref:ATP-dependent RNA helicase n=1 Tax=Coptis chinensis TaxID=261450 RepID=A0A835IK55_9MAGN|nr:hypothetical protein IFM89_039483 [Coptis chinensis]
MTKKKKETQDDVTWKHCTKVGDGKKAKLKCNYCGKEYSGGVFRIKHHLACTHENVVACAKVESGVKEFFFKLLEENKMKKQLLGDEYDGGDEEGGAELVGPPVQQQYPPLQQGGGRGAGKQGGRGWGPSQPQQGGRGGYSGGPQGGPQQGGMDDMLVASIGLMNFGCKADQALFSATQTKKVEDLARLSFQTTPVYIDVDYGRSKVTVEGLQQGYCVVPSDRRFLLLYSFLKRNLSKKVMVFFSSCNSVKYHSEPLKYIQVDCSDIHGKQKQQKRTSTIFYFCKAEKGILLCTDVAARGLDIPAVEYVHRVGRTAHGEGGKGHALLFLIPEELKFLSYLKAAKVPLKEYEFDQMKLANV